MPPSQRTGQSHEGREDTILLIDNSYEETSVLGDETLHPVTMDGKTKLKTRLDVHDATYRSEVKKLVRLLKSKKSPVDDRIPNRVIMN